MTHSDYDSLFHLTGGAPQTSLAVVPPHGAPLIPPGAHGPMVHDARLHQQVQQLQHSINMLHQNQQQAPPPPPHPSAAPNARHYRDNRGRFEHDPQHGPTPSLPHAHHPHHGHPEDGPPPRHFPVGFVKTAIPAGQLGEIEVKPQVRFQGHRLAVASSCARYFNIVDIKVGKDSQLAATGEMPAEAFSSVSVGTQMELDPAPPGIVITLIVRNIDAQQQDFGAVLYGVVEETKHHH